MIRHTVLFQWAEDATDEQKKAVSTELAKLPSIVPSIRAFAFGPDSGFAARNFDFAVTADFDDESGYFAYRDDPGHRELVQRYITPIAAQRAAVQFKF